MSYNGWVRNTILISGGLVIGITCYYGIRKWFTPTDDKKFPKLQSSYTPYGSDAREIAKQNEEYLQSLLEDQKKERQIELKKQEIRAQKEAEDLENALLESKREFEASEKLRKLKVLLEKVKRGEQCDPNQLYYTCKLAMVDGTTFFRKVSSTGTFEQLFDFIDTREVDQNDNHSVPLHVPEKYILLSDFPRVVYERDQVFCEANLTLSKKFEFKIRVEGVYEPGDSRAGSKHGLSLI
jgi:hypothetical protein